MSKKIIYVENGIGYGGAIICLRHLIRNLDCKHFAPTLFIWHTCPRYEDVANEAKWQHIPSREFGAAQQQLLPAY